MTFAGLYNRNSKRRGASFPPLFFFLSTFSNQSRVASSANFAGRQTPEERYEKTLVLRQEVPPHLRL